MDSQRLELALGLMTDRREALLEAYLRAVEVHTWDESQSMEAVNAAGRLHDCDRHITNLQMEIKRSELKTREVAHAS